MTNQQHEVLQFGAFQIDSRFGEVHKNGVVLKLGSRETRILLALLENPGELVTRSELRRDIWPNDTFVEFDNGLNNAISLLRRALGDTPDNPYFIRTVPRRGYRFIASVKCRSAEKLTFRFRRIFFGLAERMAFRRCRGERVKTGGAIPALTKQNEIPARGRIG